VVSVKASSKTDLTIFSGSCACKCRKQQKTGIKRKVKFFM